MFDTNKEDLKDILRKVEEGKLQLPDFQRDYVWGDEDVKSLIASVGKGFPVGALLTLETGGDLRFKPRLLTGVPAKDVTPAELLLDGQQRMTSLYQATFAKTPVRTVTPNRKVVERFYYLNIETAINGSANLDEAIIGVPGDKIVKKDFGRTIELDLSTPESEYANHCFPLNKVFDNRDWIYSWRSYWRELGQDVSELDAAFVRGVLDPIERYKMPIIRLDRENSREAICLVFEKVNVGGKKLDAFELVTAIYAASEFDLREDWMGTKGSQTLGRRDRIAADRREVLKEIASTDFLQACTLLHTRELRVAKERDGFKDKELPQVSCKREALLSLPLEAYQKHAGAVEKGFKEAAVFLNELKIIWHKDVPYPPQLIGLAAVYAILGDRAQSASAKQKLSQWFWSVVLGELYGSSTESRLSRDVPELVEWIGEGGSKPRSLDTAIFQRDRLHSLRSRNSAAYKGIHALLMTRGCRDFVTGRPVELMTFFNDKIDIHHIFPQDFCKKKGILPGRYDSIVNKTGISFRTNRAIGGQAPSLYLKKIERDEGLSPDTLDEILRSHLIDPEHLRNDDFDAFYEERIAQLSRLVSQAMLKPVIEEHGTNEEELDMAEIEHDFVERDDQEHAHLEEYESLI